MLNNLTLVLYSSTRGHWGFKNSYEFTINNLKKIFRSDFDRLNKYCNVKRGSEEDEYKTFCEMDQFLTKNGFKVLATDGAWSHNNSSHAVGYYQDMLSVFDNIYHTEYTFVCEDDWLIHSEEPFWACLESGIDFLNKNKNALCIRINSEPDKRKDGATEVRRGIYRQDESFTPYGSTFTFQPTIVRTRDWWHSLRIINQNLHLLETTHCELLSGYVFKQFSNDTSPFYFFNPDLIWCEHIGEKEKLERLNKIS